MLVLLVWVLEVRTSHVSYGATGPGMNSEREEAVNIDARHDMPIVLVYGF